MDVEANCAVGGCPNKVRLGLVEMAILHDTKKPDKTCTSHRFIRVGRRPGAERNHITPVWHPNTSGLITEELWSKIQEYQEPGSLNAANALAGFFIRRPGESFDSFLQRWNESPQGVEFFRVLSLPGYPTTVWQFTAICTAMKTGSKARRCTCACSRSTAQ